MLETIIEGRCAAMDNTQISRSVNSHYGLNDLGTAFIEALRAEGKDPENLSYQDLATADHFHSRGKEATLELAQMADLRPGQSVLDVGGGIGGPARLLAAEFGCVVTVLDLTEEYCRVGEMLTARTGLSDKVTFKVGNALDLPFSDGSFDVVWTQHSSMNIADKERLYSEANRVLRPSGRLSILEIMAGPEQPIHVPVPWADTQEISFLRPEAEMRALIAAAGFKEVAWINLTQKTQEWLEQRAAATAAAGPNGPPPLGTHILMRDKSGTSNKNVMDNVAEGRIVFIGAVFDRL
jgi:ubiquinone/menaquinone biosynthesis C-methylase UbiE